MSETIGRIHEWQELESNVVGDFQVFRVRCNRSRSPRTGATHEFHVLDVPRCVKVLPITTDGRIVMVQQYRHALRAMTLEFPAGVIEDGEHTLAAARRELEEETGYVAELAQLLGEVAPDPAIQSNTVSLVVAEGCRAIGTRHQDAGEDVEVQVVDAAAIGGLIASGRIVHSLAITAWYLYTVRNASTR